MVIESNTITQHFFYYFKKRQNIKKLMSTLKIFVQKIDTKLIFWDITLFNRPGTLEKPDSGPL